jgi:GAF domain-containing protein
MSYLKVNRSVKYSPASFDPLQKMNDEDARLKALRKLGIFNTPSEEIFSIYAELAARSLKTPIGLMSFVEEDSVYYKEAFGSPVRGEVVPKKNSPCSIAIQSNEVVTFRYKLTEPCVLADEKQLAEVGYKFYAGAPLTTSDGFRIGMLAVADRELRTYSEGDLSLLKKISEEIIPIIEYRAQLSKAKDIALFNNKLKELRARIDALRA